MNILIALVAALAIVGCSHGFVIELPEWDLFKFNFDKIYSDIETESMRRNNFEVNRKYVDAFNAKNNKSYSLRINQLADLSPEEMKVLHGFRAPNIVPGNTLESERFLQSIYDKDAPIPNEVDWRKVPGRVSKVKEQGFCGSCWAFATTGVLEGQQKVHQDYMRRKHDGLVSLSEQNLVDCVSVHHGCQGGSMMNAFDYIKKNGIEDEQSYPYEDGDDKGCRFNKTESVMSDKGYVMLPRGDEEKLKEVVAKYGPVSVAIDATNPDFSWYKDGIYKDDKCGTHLLAMELTRKMVTTGSLRIHGLNIGV